MQPGFLTIDTDRLPSLSLTKTRDAAIIFLVVTIYTLAGFIYVWNYSDLTKTAHSLYYGKWALNFLFTFPLVGMLLIHFQIIRRADQRRRLAFRSVYDQERLSQFFSGTAILTALMFFTGTFTTIKTALSNQTGFIYDVMLANVDKTIHVDTDPWKWFEPLIANQTALSVIEWNYGIGWFVICYGLLFWACVSPKAADIRTRYVMCFMILWAVLGNILAGIFISAGPAFYGQVTGDEGRFAPLLQHLAISSDNPASAAGYQDYLWQAYLTGDAGFGTGISAFPSIHVALITMNALFVNDFNKKLGLLMFLYVGIIQASSVALGWHYAIDGYISIAFVIALHFVAKQFSSSTAISQVNEEMVNARTY